MDTNTINHVSLCSAERATMTVLTYSRQDVDLVTRWLDARENEKRNVRIYHGNRPCLPAEALLAVCRRIFSKPTTQP